MSDVAELSEADAAEAEERTLLIEAVRDGAPVELAAYGLGWSRLKLRRALENEGFAEMIEAVEDLKDSTIEQVIYQQAKAGREWAVKLWAFNRMPERWKDTRHIQVTGSIDVPAHVIEATRRQVQTVVAAALSAGGIAELQNQLLGELGAGPIIDAEVID